MIAGQCEQRQTKRRSDTEGLCGELRESEWGGKEKQHGHLVSGLTMLLAIFSK